MATRSPLHRRGRDGAGVHPSTRGTTLDPTPPASLLSQASWAPEGLRRALVKGPSRGPTHTHTLPGFESLESWALRANCPEPAFLISKAGIVRIKKTKCSDGLMPW